MSSSDQSMQDAVSRLPFAMVLTDPRLDDNPITYVNDAFQKVTLHAREFAVGRNCRFLQGDDTDPADIQKIRDGVRKGEDVAVDIVNYKADGTRFTNRLLVSPIRNEEGEVVSFVGIQRDLGQMPPESQDELAKRPSQDVMLAEVQHRVKNHLAMIVSMIRMQATNEITPASFDALSHRVEALALLYDELSGSGVGHVRDEVIPAGAYLSRVCAALAAIDGRGSIRVTVECEEISLPVEATARLGLLVTEFITNALEHAFEDREEGVVRIRFQKLTRGGIRLMVEDDGVGLPEGSNWPWDSSTVEETRAEEEAGSNAGETIDTRGHGGRSGMGGTIVVALVKSLGASLDINATSAGTVIRLDLPSKRDGSGERSTR